MAFLIVFSGFIKKKLAPDRWIGEAPKNATFGLVVEDPRACTHARVCVCVCVRVSACIRVGVSHSGNAMLNSCCRASYHS